MRVGVAGLGKMGSAFAQNRLSHDYLCILRRVIVVIIMLSLAALVAPAVLLSDSSALLATGTGWNRPPRMGLSLSF